MFRISLIGFIALCATHAYAQQDCADITDDNARLHCYDTTSDTQETPAHSPPRQLNHVDIKDVSDYFNDRPILKLTAHNPSYFLPMSYNANTNGVSSAENAFDFNEDEVEVKFQLSGKMKLFDDIYDDSLDLWFAYTQTSWWQLYNTKESAPFRETNYSPELFATYHSNIELWGLTLVQTDIGFIHQSNGRSEPLSRSWNRIYASFELTKDNFLLSIKPWYRIPESASDDDNPNIENYVGYGDYRLTYKDGGNLYSVLFRNNFKLGGDNKSSVEINWAFPVYEVIDLYFQYYNGYGESLIDYDQRVNRISVGFLIYDWF